MATPVKTLGTTIKSGNAGVTAATAVPGGVVAIDGLPQKKFDKFETSRVSQTGLVKTYRVTLADGGMLGLTLGPLEGADVSEFSDIYAALDALADGDSHSWRVTNSAGDTMDFEGPVVTFGPTAGGANTEMLLKFEVQVSGDITFTAAA